MQTQDQAVRNALAKLPGGWVFPRDPASVTGKTLAPLAAEHVRFEEAAEALLGEAMPSSATFLLPDYERVLGPDECLAPVPNLDGRRQSAHARWVGTQGASRANIVALAARYGFTVSITEFHPARYDGRTRYGQPGYGAAWTHAWQVNAPGTTVTPARYGRARYGDPYRQWGNAVLACVLRRVCPAHTVMILSFVGPLAAARWDEDGWDGGGPDAAGWAA